MDLILRKNHLVIFLILIFIVFAATVCVYADSLTKEIKVKIHNKTYTFELAETKQERSKGLMFRKELAPDSGMFFIFNKPDYLTFYMKHTIIPLDIAFIDQNLTIVDIRKLHPLDTTFVTSKAKAIYALEVNRGFFQRVGLKPGDKIELITNLLEQ